MDDQDNIIYLSDFVRETPTEEGPFCRYECGAVDLRVVMKAIQNSKDLTEKYYSIYSKLDKVDACSIKKNKVTIIGEDGDFIYKYEIYIKNNEEN